MRFDTPAMLNLYYHFVISIHSNLSKMNPTELKKILTSGSLLFLSFTLLYAQESFKPKYNNSIIYSGIEVGSKGVKLSVVELGKNAQTRGAFNVLKDSTINTDFISFSEPTFQATLEGLYGLFSLVTKKYMIPSNKVFTVISSGVRVQAEKDNKYDWINKLIKDFRNKINDPDRKVEVIDVMGEARLSHLGIVPDEKRFKTFLIDIGSGNTKGGFFPYGNTKDFKLFQISWGTKSTANATEKSMENDEDKTLVNYNKQMARVLSGAENSEIIYQVNSSGAYPLSDNIAISGGIAWSVATLLHPEQIDNAIVPVSFEEVVGLSQNLYNNFSSLSDAALIKNINDANADKAGIAKEILRVHKVFDQRSLMAGTGILLKIMRQFASVYETKQFYLVKSGQVGWISAYVDQHSDK